MIGEREGDSGNSVRCTGVVFVFVREELFGQVALLELVIYFFLFP